jgi:serine/threonine protein kinase
MRIVQSELEQNRLIATLDPSSEFSVETVQYCEANLANIPQAELGKCKPAFSKSSGPVHQLIIRNAGKQLSAVKVTDMLAISKAFGDIITKGLITLAKNGFTHFDIKPDNVVYSISSDKCVLIDFGLIAQFRTVFSSQSKYLLIHEYRYYPMEFKHFAMLRGYMKGPHDSSHQTDSIDDLYGTYMPVFFQGWKADSQALLNWMSIVFTSHSFQKAMTVFAANKIDIFSCGVTLLETWIKRAANLNTTANKGLAKLLRFILAAVDVNFFRRPCPAAAAQLWKGIHDPAVSVQDFYAAVLSVQNLEVMVALANLPSDMALALNLAWVQPLGEAELLP